MKHQTHLKAYVLKEKLKEIIIVSAILEQVRKQ